MWRREHFYSWFIIITVVSVVLLSFINTFLFLSIWLNFSCTNTVSKFDHQRATLTTWRKSSNVQQLHYFNKRFQRNILELKWINEIKSGLWDVNCDKKFNWWVKKEIVKTRVTPSEMKHLRPELSLFGKKIHEAANLD